LARRFEMSALTLDTKVPAGSAFAIYGQDISRIQYAAKRLFSQDRLNADQMRDMAQSLEVILDHLEELNF